MGHVACANNAWGNIAASIGLIDTTIALTSGQGQRFPATDNGDWFYITLIDPTGVLEIAKITARNGDILTAQRGADGTDPHSFPAGSAVELRPVAAWFKDFMAAFMARDGQYAATADTDMGGFRLKNLHDPTAAQDAVTRQFLDTKLPIGAGILWWGDWAAQKTAIEAAGWRLCDGGNGTPDMRGKVLRGAMGAVSGDTGGADSITLAIGNLPAHAHGVNDGGHNHGVNDPGHNHGVNDPGHQHIVPWGEANQNDAPWGVWGSGRYGSHDSDWDNQWRMSSYSGTGIYLSGSGTGIWLNGSGANISIQNTGGGQPFDNRPAFIGWHFLMRVA